MYNQVIKRRQNMNKRSVFVLVLAVLLSLPVLCADTRAFKYSIGIDGPCFGWLQRNSSGQVEADLGVNLGLGISYKRYFESLKFNRDFDPSKTENISPYWAIGTYSLILPYAGVGIDYAWNNGFYLGVGLLASSGIYYVVGPGYIGYIGPEIHGGLMF
jgi:hypothetical protein